MKEYRITTNGEKYRVEEKHSFKILWFYKEWWRLAHGKYERGEWFKYINPYPVYDYLSLAKEDIQAREQNEPIATAWRPILEHT